MTDAENTAAFVVHRFHRKYSGGGQKNTICGLVVKDRTVAIGALPVGGRWCRNCVPHTPPRPSKSQVSA